MAEQQVMTLLEMRFANEDNKRKIKHNTSALSLHNYESVHDYKKTTNKMLEEIHDKTDHILRCMDISQDKNIELFFDKCNTYNNIQFEHLINSIQNENHILLKKIETNSHVNKYKEYLILFLYILLCVLLIFNFVIIGMLYHLSNQSCINIGPIN